MDFENVARILGKLLGILFVCIAVPIVFLSKVLNYATTFAGNVMDKVNGI